MTILEQNINNYLSYCDKGLRGEFRLPVKEVSIPLTNVCNNYCIMCQFCSKEYENHTYFNEEPFFMTLEQYKKIVPAPRKNLLEKIFMRKKCFEQKLSFYFAAGETLLNPHLRDILKYTKELYPNSTIRLISNATVPPKQDIVKYIDRIAFSIDGATAETFEKLRPPAKFDHVLKTLRAWDESAEKYNKSFAFCFTTVVSTANIDELEDMLRLASGFKHVDSVYLNPINIYESKRNLDYLSLKNVKKEKIESVVAKLDNISNGLGIRVDNLFSLKSATAAGEKTTDDSFIDEKSKFCHYPWNGILSFTSDGKLRYFCCYAYKKQSDRLMERYKIKTGSGLSLEEVYNCKEFWQYRKDMLQGKLLATCQGCGSQTVGYEAMRERLIDIENETLYM